MNPYPNNGLRVTQLKQAQKELAILEKHLTKDPRIRVHIIQRVQTLSNKPTFTCHLILDKESILKQYTIKSGQVLIWNNKTNKYIKDLFNNILTTQEIT